MAEKNYYEILGIDKKASEDEIKKAYRKLVRQYHPDVSKDPNADAKMGEINNAYETLKDSEKRAQYDMMLNNPFGGFGNGANNFSGFAGGGFGGSQGMNQEDLDEILRQFGGAGGSFGSFNQNSGFNRGNGFGFEDIFANFTGGGRSQQRQNSQNSMKGDDIHSDISVDLQASYQGATRKITLSIPVQTMSGTQYQDKTIEVKIPKGIAEGQKIRLAKQGNPSAYGAENGDLYLTVKFQHNEREKVVGKDVFLTVDVAPWEAVFGGEITVITPVGKVTVNVPKNSRTGTKLRLKGKGIPAKTAGDLFLQLNIVLPMLADDEHRSEEQLQAWRFLQDVYSDFTPNR